MKRLLTATSAALLLAGGAWACIEALTLEQMVAKTDMAVEGTVTGVRTTAYTPPGDHELIYTILTIEGEDLYSGKPTTLEAAFLGGVYKGRNGNVTSMPHPSEYAVGSHVVVFSAPVQGWGPEIGRCVYAAMGGIFREIPTPRGPVIQGKGEGFAIDRNVPLAELRDRIARALAAKEVK